MRSTTSASVVNTRGEQRGEGEHHHGGEGPAHHGQHQQAPAGRSGLAARPAPRRPTMAWAAMARASSAMARKLQISNATWWAATDVGPMCTATAVSASSEPRSAAACLMRS